MSESGRTLAIDLGEVRVGLALSDPLGIFAQPLETVKRIGPRKDIARITGVVRDEGVKRIVVGLPLLMSGEEGEGARTAREFAERLGRSVPGVDIEMWDERLTTVQAERALIFANVRRGKRRKVVDAAAAVLILQNYLDARSGRDATPRAASARPTAGARTAACTSPMPWPSGGWRAAKPRPGRLADSIPTGLDCEEAALLDHLSHGQGAGAAAQAPMGWIVRGRAGNYAPRPSVIVSSCGPTLAAADATASGSKPKTRAAVSPSMERVSTSGTLPKVARSDSMVLGQVPSRWG